MEVVTIQSDAFQALAAQITTAICEKLDLRDIQSKEKWLDNQEAIEYLHVSKRTLQHYRDSQQLSFSQRGNKIYYKLSDIELFLEEGYVNRNKKRA